MIDAFQDNAFQSNAFQEAIPAPAATTGGSPIHFPENFPPPVIYQPRRPVAPDARFFTHVLKKSLDEQREEEFLLVVLAVA